MWEAIFNAANVWALAMWAVLVLAPRRPFPLTLVLYGGVGLLCLAYAAMFVVLFGGFIDPARDAGLAPANLSDLSLAGIKDLFRSEGGVTLGWVHYLAFDLFTGLWIARDADDKGFSRVVQAPVLLLTFLAGPLGLLVWLMVRERRARRAAKARKA